MFGFAFRGEHAVLSIVGGVVGFVVALRGLSQERREKIRASLTPERIALLGSLDTIVAVVGLGFFFMTKRGRTMLKAWQVQFGKAVKKK